MLRLPVLPDNGPDRVDPADRAVPVAHAEVAEWAAVEWEAQDMARL